jgi:hypothetical protein
VGSAVAGAGGETWLADVIHVNEDGWVLINRGERTGVFTGLQLLVVGSGIRELRNLFAPRSNDGGDNARHQPVVLRTRRTYEQLEVVYVEADCAIAIATRTPSERRPSFYRGPDGELLVWVPLPEGYTFPDADASSASTDENSYYGEDRDGDEPNVSKAMDDGNDTDAAPDTPPESNEQEDQRWEESLPLNGVAVGDLVVPAIPVNATPG